MNLDALDVRSEPPAALHHGVPHLARGEYLAIKWKTRRLQGSCLPKTPIFPYFRQNIPHLAGLVLLGVAGHHAGLRQPQGHGVVLRQLDPGLEARVSILTKLRKKNRSFERKIQREISNRKIFQVFFLFKTPIFRSIIIHFCGRLLTLPRSTGSESSCWCGC